jgi:hypothetical protein
MIREAHRVLREILPPTPARTFPHLNRQLGAEIWLKLEAWQPTGSFKVRGALARMNRLRPEERAHGVVTASAGDHGLAVAFAAPFLSGIPATVFVPETAAPNKVPALEAFDVYLERVGRTYAEAHAAALAFARASGEPVTSTPMRIRGWWPVREPSPWSSWRCSRPSTPSWCRWAGAALISVDRPGLPGPRPPDPDHRHADGGLLGPGRLIAGRTALTRTIRPAPPWRTAWPAGWAPGPISWPA